MTTGELTPAALLRSAAALAPLVRSHADQGEASRRLPAPVLRAMVDSGLFRLLVPRNLGGFEADPVTMIESFDEVSRADGSAGWCLMIGATTGVNAGYLPPEGALEIYGNPGWVTGGVLAPRGRAVEVDGGFRLSGRWPFASGCEHCQWLLGGALVGEGDGAASGLRLLYFSREDARIIDTWDVAGLKGTGSHDIAVEDLVVPTSRVVTVGARAHQLGPLYRFPIFGLLAVAVASVGLGIARAAIDSLGELAVSKVPTGSRRQLGEREAVQSAVSRAEAALGSARAYMLEQTGRAWDQVCAGDRVSPRERALLRIAATNAAIASATAVDLMYNAGGATGIYQVSPLQRQFRDVHTLTQHMVVAPPTLELAGRVLLGLPADVSML